VEAEEALSAVEQMSAEEAEEERRYQLDPAQKLVCRYYENQYPDLEEVVMVNVRNIADMGAYVTLLEVVKTGERRNKRHIVALIVPFKI
jgi:hypothetical protein